jgi:hypothetical protein
MTGRLWSASARFADEESCPAHLRAVPFDRLQRAGQILAARRGASTTSPLGVGLAVKRALGENTRFRMGAPPGT